MLCVRKKALTSGVAQTFGKLLKSLIDKRFPSLRGFIRRAQPLANESGAVGYLSKVIAGTKPPPMDRIDAWADALDLQDEARQEFLNLALEDLLARAPDDLRKWVDSLRTELVQVREQLQTSSPANSKPTTVKPT